MGPYRKLSATKMFFFFLDFVQLHWLIRFCVALYKLAWLMVSKKKIPSYSKTWPIAHVLLKVLYVYTIDTTFKIHMKCGILGRHLMNDFSPADSG